MCGRFVLSQRASVYADWFGAGVIKTEELAPNYNVAPTDLVYAVAEYQGDRQLGSFRWGLVPWFSKDRKTAARHINARVETVATKPSFKDSFTTKRCLVPADGFYEWQRMDKGKLPHYIHSTDGGPLAFAGLWASWKDPQTEERFKTCTILTGEPTELVKPIHDRMPVMIDRSLWDAWLGPSDDVEELLGLLRSRKPVEVALHPVSSLVNSVKNNLPELIEPLH
ncbi:MAG: SOS response-associated peptidase [Acidimicrobiia bacterium]